MMFLVTTLAILFAYSVIMWRHHVRKSRRIEAEIARNMRIIEQADHEEAIAHAELDKTVGECLIGTCTYCSYGVILSECVTEQEADQRWYFHKDCGGMVNFS